jgi:uncharacterized protein
MSGSIQQWAGENEPAVSVLQPMEEVPLPGREFTRTSEFSYRCNGCGRCCHNKRIQTSPYEVMRLARNLKLSTGEFLIRFIDSKGPYLRVRENGACVFLDGKRCRVHEDRPLACRTYPLGLFVSPEGVETFLELRPHPLCEGVYGRDGTVDRYVNQQGVQPYLIAARQYMSLFYRLHEELHLALSTDAAAVSELQTVITASDGSGLPAFTPWFDVDRMVAEYCENQGVAVPAAISEMVKLHIHAIEHLLNTLKGGEA